MTNLIIWAILIIPFACIPLKGIPEPTRLIKEALFDFTMMALIVLAVKNGLKFEYRNKYLSWIALWGFFQLGFNWYFPLVMGYGFNAGTIVESMHFLLAVLGTLLFCSSVDRSSFIRISKAIVVSGTMVGIFGIFQVIGLDPMMKIATHTIIPGSSDHRVIAALMDHPDLFGNYMALCLPFCLYLKDIKYKLCLAVLFVALIMAQSSLSIIAAVVGMAVFLLFKYRNKTAFLSVCGSLLLFVCFCMANPKFNKLTNGFTGRIGAWQEFIHKCVNPLFGNGFGVPKSYGVKLGNQYWTTPHNDYLTIWLCLGFLGVLLFGLLAIHAFRNFNYNQANTLGSAYMASLLAFFILMFGSFPMESAPLALIGLVSFWAMEKSATWKSV